MAENRFIILHRLLRKLQQTNRFIKRAYNTPLSLAASHLLVELDAAPQLSAAQLAALLNLSPTFLSREISALKAESLLETTRDESDGRRQLLIITKQGRQVLATMDRNANDLMTRFASRLSMEEQTRFREYQRAMCDGLNAPPAAARPQDHPLLVEGRRMTRAFRFLSDNAYWGENLSVLEWHLLVRLFEFGSRNPVQLAETLGVPKNTLSTTISRLTERGVIDRSVADNDRRGRVIQISQQGITTIRQIEERAAEELRVAMSRISPDQLSEYISLFERFLGQPSAGAELLLQPRITISPLLGNDDRAAARSFLIRVHYEESLLDRLPETIIGSNNWCVALCCEGRIEAVLELAAPESIAAGAEKKGQERWRLLNFAASKFARQGDLLPSFLNRAIEHFRSTHKTGQIEFDHPLLPKGLPQAL